MDADRICPKCGRALNPKTGGCLSCLAALAFALEEPSELFDPPQAHSSTAATSKLRYFGDYELLEEIARGGMGVVFKARQSSLNRIVAVKMLLSGQFAQKDFIARFRTEARASANLQHPHIVAIHEVGEHEGHQYFSMDYIQGGHLGDWVREQPLLATPAAAVVQKIAGAVHYAHEQGVLHRDLKPSNILIDSRGEPRVTDFGLAKHVAGSVGVLASLEEENPTAPKPGLQPDPPDLTLTGQVLGTPNYMAPEQASGRRGAVAATSDIYALGAILYFLLTGRPPVQAGSVEAALDQLLRHEPVSPRLLNPSVPRDLETICLKCLEKEPRKRYGTARELADELGRFLNGETIIARPISRPEKAWRWCRRKPALATLIAALHVVSAAGLAGILWQWSRAEQNAANETTQRVRAEQAVTLLELQRAEDLLDKDEIVMGVAYLARIVRQQPTNHIAGQRLLAALTQRNFALPIGQPLQHGRKVCHAEFSPDGRRVVTASLDLAARVWDARTGTLLVGPMLHRAGVRCAHFSPDGQQLVTVSDDSQARLWDAATGRPLGQSLAHSNTVHTAHFSPDGQRVVTASDDGTARIWNAHTGEPMLEPLTHRGGVLWARFSPNGQRIATASEDKTARVWDATTGRPVTKPLPHEASVTEVSFSPGGSRVLTAALDFSTHLWDAASGKPLTEPFFPGAQINSARFSPDGERILVALHDGLTRVYSAVDWTPLSPPIWHRRWVASAEFDSEGQRILTGSLDNSARLWDALSGAPLTPPMQHDGLVWDAHFSPDGLFVVTASADRTARLWDVRPGSARSQLMEHQGPVRVAEFSPDGRWVVTGSQDNTARIWNAHSGEQAGKALAHTDWVLAAKFSPDGRSVATATQEGTARVWSVPSGLPLTPPLLHRRPGLNLDFSPDGRWLATGSSDGTVRVWDASSGAPHGEPIRHRAEVAFVCFSPDGQCLLSADVRDDQAQIHDFASRRLLMETPSREGQIFQGEFSPDGRKVVTASEDGTAWIWDSRTGQPLTEPMRHKGELTQARFSRDGRWVVTASVDATAQVWDARTAQPVGEPLRHRGNVNTAEFSPDGRLVLTASNDGTARLWDSLTGRPVAEAFEHDGMVVSARFSPEGRRVLTASYSGRAHIWDVPPTLPTSSETGPSLFLADLAEAVVGKHVNALGALENISSARLDDLRSQLGTLPPATEVTRWLNWFLADRNTRAPSPYSEVRQP